MACGMPDFRVLRRLLLTPYMSVFMRKKFNKKIGDLLYTPVEKQAGVRVQQRNINYGVENQRGEKSTIKVNLKEIKHL